MTPLATSEKGASHLGPGPRTLQTLPCLSKPPEAAGRTHLWEGEAVWGDQSLATRMTPSWMPAQLPCLNTAMSVPMKKQRVFSNSQHHGD